MFCPKCGVENPDHAKFCFKCGSKFPNINKKSKINLKSTKNKLEPIEKSIGTATQELRKTTFELSSKIKTIINDKRNFKKK